MESFVCECDSEYDKCKHELEIKVPIFFISSSYSFIFELKVFKNVNHLLKMNVPKICQLC